MPPSMEWNWGGFVRGGPKLGIDAEDLSGQFGNYFGAPEGEGVLVRDVLSGSPAEKAGLKAGDVIVKLDGERIRTAGDLRAKLAEKHAQKTVTLSVLRNHSEISVTAEPEQPPPPADMRKLLGARTNI